MSTTYTTNYHLGKQTDTSDNFDMSVITDNMDIIDTQMKSNENNILLKANTSDVNTAATNLQAQIDQIAQAAGTGTADTEVAQARVAEDGTTYLTLKARLDAGDAKAEHLTKDLEIKTENVLSQISDKEYTAIELTKTSGKILSSNGEVIDGGSNYYVSDLIDISSYSVVFVTAQSGYNNRIFALYDTNGEFVSDYQGGTSAFKEIADYELVVPESVKYIRLSQWYTITPMACRYATYAPAGVSELRNDISETAKEVLAIENEVLTTERGGIEYNTTAGYVISSDGTVKSTRSSYAISEEIPIAEYKKVYISASANYANLLYAFYDENAIFISGEASVGSETGTTIENKEVAVPANAVTLRVANISPNVSALGADKFTISGLTDIVNQVGSLTASVDELSEDFSEIIATETYPVVLHPELTISEGYVDKNGREYSTASTYKHTQKIPVSSGNVIYLTTPNGVINSRFVTAYNGDSAVPSSGAEYVGKYTVPEGITHVVFSIASTYNNVGCTNEAEKESKVLTPINGNDVLYGKKWAVLGDSFSYGGYSPMNVFDDGKYAGSRKVYPYYIGNRTHINIIDFTLGGRTLAYPSDGTFSNSLTNPNAEFYYQNIPVDTDYITIYIGINDSHHASGGGDGEDPTGYIPIGTVDDDTTASFGGAWNVVLSWLIANRPNAHIGIIVSNGCDSDAYRTLTIAIAQKYGIPYIDLNGDQNTPAMIRTTNPGIAPAVKNALIAKWAVEPGVNTHPNDDAHEFESFCIEAFLRRL